MDADELAWKESCDGCARHISWVDPCAICDNECTWCLECTEDLGWVCPNCSGELRKRPRRTQPGPNRMTRVEPHNDLDIHR